MPSKYTSVEVTFVRHGQTDYNLKKIFSQGQANIPLNENGLNQAVLAGKSLSQNHFDTTYSSDLIRAFKTAEILVQENQVVQKPVNIKSEVILREMGHGIYEQKPKSVLREAAKRAGFSEEERRNFRPPGGENQDDVEQRAKEFLAKLIQDISKDSEKQNSILVVSHGIFLLKLFKMLLEKDVGKKETREGRKADLSNGMKIPNTGISKFKMTIDLENMDLISTKCFLFLSDEHLNK